MTNSPQQKIPDGFHTRALDDGNVEFMFVIDGKQIVAGLLTPEQLSTVVTNFLTSAHSAFHNSDKQIAPAQSKFRGQAVPVTRWYVCDTNLQNQQALVVEVGESSIGLVVPAEKVREFARYLITAGTAHHSSLSSFGLLREAGRDFYAGMQRFGTVLSAQIRASSRRLTTVVWSKLSGRSLVIFRTIKISPDSQVLKYDPVGRCIYCDAAVYSNNPLLGERKLGAEHVVPEGIGGTVELPEASCAKCESITGAKVEGTVLGKTLKALRIHLGLKKSGTGPHPKFLALNAQVDGIDKLISEFPVEDYPIVLFLLVYWPPKLGGTGGSGKAITGARTVTLKYDQKALYKKYRITGFASAVWDNQMLCRMLAKIGHSFAVAELKSNNFAPLLLKMISGESDKEMDLVGSDPDIAHYPTSDALHEISLGYQSIDSSTYVVAKIRLFAKYGGPIYLVIVGKSLESFIARWTRVLTNKISFAFAS